MNKIINPGKVKIDGHYRDVFCTIKIKNGKLSITGVEGPKSNGDCFGSCGQIGLHIDEINSDWNESMIDEFKKVWEEWHLNDFRPGCSHQKEWGKKKLVVVKWKLKSEIMQKRRDIEKECMELIKTTGYAKITDEQQIILSLRYTITYPELDPRYVPYYEKDSEEQKSSGWTTLKEHPEGELNKPCPECGYRYGSAWNKEELPSEVITFLQNLPESKIKYPWGS